MRAMFQAEEMMEAKLLRQTERGELQIPKESHHSWKEENKDERV